MVGPTQGFVLTLRTMTVVVMLLLGMSTKIAAKTQVNASVDRDSIYQNDTLTLQIKGSSELELNSIGGIFDFGRNQISEPELGTLTDDFEILQQRQGRNMEVLNGTSRSTTTWVYELAPKRTGQLNIPAIEFQGQQTQALVIEVKAGSAPKDSSRPPAVFFEIDIDKPAPYVQEQVLYTVRLFSLGQLESGDWSDPSANDVIVERLGDTSTFYRMAYNQRYEVRERKYALFPQKSGTLELPAQRFQGVMIDMRQRRRVRINESSDSTSLKVKAPPASFTGNTWLPATSFELLENWSQNPDNLQIGDSVTRSLEIKALGLLDSALPSLTAKTKVRGDTNILKFYPEKPQSQNAPHATGVQAQRAENSAIIAVEAGSVSIEAIEIPWWDTINDEQRVAVIPARLINIATKPLAGASTNAFTNSAAKPSTSRSNVTTPALADSKNKTESAPTKPSANTTPSSNNDSPADDNSRTVSSDILWSIIVLILFAWAASAWLLWQRGNKLAALTNANIQSNTTNPVDALSLKALKQACTAQDPNLPKLILAWLSQASDASGLSRGRMQTHISIGDIEHLHPDLAALLRRYEHARYGDDDQAALEALGQDIQVELSKIEKYIKQTQGATLNSARANNTNTLLPFYP